MAIVLALSVASADDKTEKIDPSKLVGKWEPTVGNEEAKAILEFTKDEKITITHAKAENSGSGTYTIDGKNIIMSIKIMNIEIKQTIVVTKLTDTEMVTKADVKERTETLKRIKDK